MTTAPPTYETEVIPQVTSTGVFVVLVAAAIGLLFLWAAWRLSDTRQEVKSFRRRWR